MLLVLFQIRTQDSQFLNFSSLFVSKIESKKAVQCNKAHTHTHTHEPLRLHILLEKSSKLLN